jgi:hypothetical protein
MGLNTSVQEQARKEKLRIREVGRELDFERRQMRREAAELEQDIRRLLSQGMNTEAQQVARCLAQMRVAEQRNASRAVNLTMVRFEIGSMVSSAAEKKVLAGYAKVAKAHERSSGPVNHINVLKLKQKSSDIQRDTENTLADLAAGDEEVQIEDVDSMAEEIISKMQDAELLKHTVAVPAGKPGHVSVSPLPAVSSDVKLSNART